MIDGDHPLEDARRTVLVDEDEQTDVIIARQRPSLSVKLASAEEPLQLIRSRSGDFQGIEGREPLQDKVNDDKVALHEDQGENVFVKEELKTDTGEQTHSEPNQQENVTAAEPDAANQASNNVSETALENAHPPETPSHDGSGSMPADEQHVKTSESFPEGNSLNKIQADSSEQLSKLVDIVHSLKTHTEGDQHSESPVRRQVNQSSQLAAELALHSTPNGRRQH